MACRDDPGRPRLRRRQTVRVPGKLGFRYVIRFRGNIHVSAADGETRPAADWVGKGGRARKLRDAGSPRPPQGRRGGLRACHGHEGALDLAASDGSPAAPELIKLYAKRWTIEPSFRDSKDLRFGMGMSAPDRRSATPRPPSAGQRLRHPAADPAGRCGESLGMDRQLRTSTSKPRPFALPAGLPALRTDPQHARTKARPLIERYQDLLPQSASFSQAFGIV